MHISCIRLWLRSCWRFVCCRVLSVIAASRAVRRIFSTASLLLRRRIRSGGCPPSCVARCFRSTASLDFRRRMRKAGRSCSVLPEFTEGKSAVTLRAFLEIAVRGDRFGISTAFAANRRARFLRFCRFILGSPTRLPALPFAGKRGGLCCKPIVSIEHKASCSVKRAVSSSIKSRSKRFAADKQSRSHSLFLWDLESLAQPMPSILGFRSLETASVIC